MHLKSLEYPYGEQEIWQVVAILERYKLNDVW